MFFRSRARARARGVTAHDENRSSHVNIVQNGAEYNALGVNEIQAGIRPVETRSPAGESLENDRSIRSECKVPSRWQRDSERSDWDEPEIKKIPRTIVIFHFTKFHYATRFAFCTLPLRGYAVAVRSNSSTLICISQGRSCAQRLIKERTQK